MLWNTNYRSLPSTDYDDGIISASEDVSHRPRSTIEVFGAFGYAARRPNFRPTSIIKHA